MVTKILAARGRPRGFNVENALDVGQRLIHEHGYEGVGLAALTDALDIKPPSFYKAFGSKAAYFARILDRYAASVLALEGILVPGRPPADELADLLERAAKTYAQSPKLRGCLVLEAARGGSDNESAILARRTAERKRCQIRSFSTMCGLSASAREGMSKARLVAIARAAAVGLRMILFEDQNLDLRAK